MNFYEQQYSKPSSSTYHPTPTQRRHELDSPQRIPRKYSQSPNLSSQLSSPTFRQRQSSHIYTRSPSQPIWEELYEAGIKAKQEIEEQYFQNLQKIDSECTFKPSICQSKRYLLPHSSFIERNAAWQQHKIQKIIKEKQQIVSKGLKQCTFSPRLNVPSRKQTQRLQMTRFKPGMTENMTQRQINPYYSPIKQRSISIKKDVVPHKPKTKTLMSDLKKRIRTQLKRLDL